MGLVHPIVGNNEFLLKYRRQGQAEEGLPEVLPGPATASPPAATTTK